MSQNGAKVQERPQRLSAPTQRRYLGIGRVGIEDRAGPRQAAVGGLKVVSGRCRREHLGAGREIESLAEMPPGALFSPTKKREVDATNQ